MNKIYKDIKVIPYEELMDNPKGLSFHRGGPIWPDWDEAIGMRQCRNNKPIDHKPIVSSRVTFEILNEPIYWCGPIVKHFGHQVTDFLQRLPMYDSTIPGHYFGFSSSQRFNINNVNDIPQFFKEILEWFQVPLEKVKIITKPTIVKKLICISQQEQLNKVLPSSEYLNALNYFQRKNNCIKSNKEGTYYISRAAMPNGKIAGESYLENILGRNGVKVIRPEAISLSEQLRIYTTAKKIIFAEGSALHTLQILGEKAVGDVHILNRRKGRSLAEELLTIRCMNLTYYDIGETIHGLRLTGLPAPEIGITVPNSEIIRDILKDIGINIRYWSENVFEALVRDDVSIWIEREKNTERAKVPGSMETILVGLSLCGISDL